MLEAASAAADSCAGAAQSDRSSRRTCKDRGAGGQAAVIVDHTEARSQTELCILHLCRTCGSQALPQSFDEPEIGASGTGLPDRKLPARGVVRKVAVNREIVLAHEGYALALLAEAEVLELHHRDDRIVVIGLDDIEIVRLHAGHRVELIDVHRPAAT